MQRRWAYGAAAALIAITGASVAVMAARSDGHDAALQKELDALVAAGAIGAAIEIRDNRGTWTGRSGAATVTHDRPVPAGSRFRVGSITKTFVAVVALQLVDQGRIGLDDSVEKWLPGVVPGGDEITVRNLLTHTSGLPDHLPMPAFPPDPRFLESRSRTWTPNEVIEAGVSRPESFGRPGSEFVYSNTNYVLLGEIVRKATGRSYGDLVEGRIIRPLGLRGTSVPGTSETIPGPHPHGYVPIASGPRTKLVDYTEMNPSVMGAGGEMISTPADLNRFYGALFGGQLLPRRTLDLMIQPGTPRGRYGMGLFIIRTSCGTTLYGNDGDALAYNAWAYSTLDAGRQIAIALTPSFRADLDDAVDEFLEKVACGRVSPG